MTNNNYPGDIFRDEASPAVNHVPQPPVSPVPPASPGVAPMTQAAPMSAAQPVTSVAPQRRVKPRKSRRRLKLSRLLPIISLISLAICGYLMFFVLPAKAKGVTAIDVLNSTIPDSLMQPLMITIISGVIGLAAALVAAILRATRILGLIITVLAVVGLALGVPNAMQEVRHNIQTAAIKSLENKDIQKELVNQGSTKLQNFSKQQVEVLFGKLKDVKQEDITNILSELDKFAQVSGAKAKELYQKIPQAELDKLNKDVREALEKRLRLK